MTTNGIVKIGDKYFIMCGSRLVEINYVPLRGK